MSGRPYKVAIIGCGSVANFHLEGWQSCSDEVEVVALCDINPEQIGKLKAKWKDLCAEAAEYHDYRQMIEKEEFDIASVLTQGDLHYELTKACLERGKHVFMEKPVGYSLEEARRFKFLANEYPKLKVEVAYSMRYYREFMDIRALIASGELGDIMTGEVSYSHPRVMPEDRYEENGEDPGDAEEDLSYIKQQSDIAGGDTTRRTPKDSRNPYVDKGGNYMASSSLTHSTHPWDMARFIFGEVSEVFSTNSKQLFDDRGIQMGILWMRSGALVHVLAGSTRKPNIGGNQHQFLQVHGTRGSAWLVRDMYDEPYNRHALYRTDGEIQEAPRTTELPNSSHGVIIRTRNFLDAIEGREELICSMEDGARTTDLLHALYLSEHMQTKVAVLPANKTG